MTILFPLQVTREAGEAFVQGLLCWGDATLASAHGSSIGACSPPARASSRAARGCNGEICTSCCPPPHCCTGGCGEANREGEQEEVPKLTCPREQVQPSASLVLLCRGGCTPELPPAPDLSTDVCEGGQDKLPPIHVPVMRTGCTAATPGIMWEPLHSCQHWVCTTARPEVAGTSRGAGCWLPAGSQPPLGWNGASGGGQQRGAALCCSQSPWSLAGLEAAAWPAEGPGRARLWRGWR